MGTFREHTEWRELVRTTCIEIEDVHTRNLAEQNVFNEFILDQHDTLELSNESEDGGNYVLWTGLSGDLSIEGEGIGVDDGAALGGNTRRAPIQGIQIVASMGQSCDPNTMGDLDGNGSVEFADFLILSENFGSEVSGHQEGDIDCNGSVEFADFLVLSENFGSTVGSTVGAAASVPEPSAHLLLGVSMLLIGAIRRRN